MSRPKLYKVVLSEEESIRLKSVCKNKKTTQTIYQRCRILLALDESQSSPLTYDQCISALGVSRGTVAKTVKLFSTGGVDEVLATHRNINSDNARRKVDGRIEARIIEIACGPVPEGHSRWTIRLLEEKMKIELDEPISREAIRRSLKKTNFDLTATTTGASQV
ncbi:MAG TPA: helix-turn-helix domain-containing protein [Methanocorpusculum sp.]|nr:helix-turn-helix domain-containing protein [Methanocorpusculum sp.]